MGYKINGKEISFNSIKNQEIKSKFVGREVFGNVNSMVEYILNKGWEDTSAPFSWDDVSNGYEHICGECGSTDGFDEYETKTGAKKFKCCSCNKRYEENGYEELETQPAEVYEWWLVSDFLVRKIMDQGGCVIDFENIWGRQTTGQAILLDGVISRICYEMEILEGQEYEWSVN